MKGPRQSSSSSRGWLILFFFVLTQGMFYLAYLQYKSSGKASQLLDLYNTCVAQLKDAKLLKRVESDASSGSVVVGGGAITKREKQFKLQMDTAVEELALFKRRYTKMVEKVKSLQARVQEAKSLEKSAHFSSLFPKMVQTDLAVVQAIYGKATKEVTVRFTVAEIQFRILVDIQMMPHTSRYFLNLVEAGFWNKCHLVRDGGHVIQFNCGVEHPGYYPSVGFQEYNEKKPHVRYTIGLGGRPGGPDFYVSMVDNTENHGPGGQAGSQEADPCFGRLHPEDVNQLLELRKKIAKSEDDMGFLNREDMLLISEARVIKT